MKTLTNNSHLLLTVTLPILIISIWIYFGFTNIVPTLFKLNVICLFGCLALFIKSKKIKIENENLRVGRSLPKTIIKVWIYQVASVIIFLGFIKILLNLNHQPTSMSLSILNSPLEFGLLPWAAYTIICIGLLKHSYKQHAPSRLNDLILNPNTPASSTTATFWIAHFSSLTAAAIALSLSLACIYIAHCIFPNIKIIHAGWNPATIVCSAIICYMNYVITRTKLLDRLSIKKIPLPTYLFLLTIITSILTGLIYTLIMQFKPAPINPPQLLTLISSLPEKQVINISCLTWWIIWLPISAPVLAKICYATQIRPAIAILLSLPIILLCLHIYLPQLNLANSISSNSWITPFAIIAFFILILFCSTTKNKNILTFNQLPIPQPKKHRSHTGLEKKITYFFLSFLTLLLLAGNFLTNIPLLAISLATLVYMVLAVINLIVNREHIQSAKHLQSKY